MTHSQKLTCKYAHISVENPLFWPIRSLKQKNPLKTRYRNLRPNTMLPLTNGSRVVEVINMYNKYFKTRHVTYV